MSDEDLTAKLQQLSLITLTDGESEDQASQFSKNDNDTTCMINRPNFSSISVEGAQAAFGSSNRQSKNTGARKKVPTPIIDLNTVICKSGMTLKDYISSSIGNSEASILKGFENRLSEAVPQQIQKTLLAIKQNNTTVNEPSNRTKTGNNIPNPIPSSQSVENSRPIITNVEVLPPPVQTNINIPPVPNIQNINPEIRDDTNVLLASNSNFKPIKIGNRVFVEVTQNNANFETIYETPRATNNVRYTENIQNRPHMSVIPEENIQSNHNSPRVSWDSNSIKNAVNPQGASTQIFIPPNNNLDTNFQPIIRNDNVLNSNVPQIINQPFNPINNNIPNNYPNFQNPIDQTQVRYRTKYYDVERWNLKFDGTKRTMSVHDFVDRVEIMQKLNRVPWDEVLRAFNFLLEKDAVDWYWDYLKTYEIYEWSQLKGALIRKFKRFQNDSEIVRAIYTRQLRESETFEDFVRDLQKLRKELQNPMPETELINIIKDNLRGAMQQLMFPIHTYSLDSLIAEGKRAEALLKRNAPRRSFRVNEVYYDDAIQNQSQDFSQYPIAQNTNLQNLLPLQQNTMPPFYHSQPVQPIHNNSPNPLPVLQNTPVQIYEIVDNDLETNNEIAALNSKFPQNKPKPLAEIICFNCKQIGHRHKMCPVPKRNIFCYTCGLDNVCTPNCPRCNKGNHKPSNLQTREPCSEVAQSGQKQPNQSKY